MMFSNTAQYSRTTLRSDIRLATKPAVFVAHVWGERTEGEIARQGLPNDKIWICEENTSLLKETLISQWAGSVPTAWLHFAVYLASQKSTCEFIITLHHVQVYLKRHFFMYSHCIQHCFQCSVWNNIFVRLSMTTFMQQTLTRISGRELTDGYAIFF